MRPASAASYALVLLLTLCVALMVFRVLEVSFSAADLHVWTLVFQATITATVGALVWTVHRNGSHR